MQKFDIDILIFDKDYLAVVLSLCVWKHMNYFILGLEKWDIIDIKTIINIYSLHLICKVYFFSFWKIEALFINQK